MSFMTWSPHEGHRPARKRELPILFHDQRTSGVLIPDISETPKGVRPDHYRLKWGSKKHYRNTPTKDLIPSLRKGEV